MNPSFIIKSLNKYSPPACSRRDDGSFARDAKITEKYIIFICPANSGTNEKQSASGGLLIANIYVINTDTNEYYNENIPKVYFFPFCPLSRKEKEAVA